MLSTDWAIWLLVPDLFFKARINVSNDTADVIVKARPSEAS